MIGLTLLSKSFFSWDVVKDDYLQPILTGEGNSSLVRPPSSEVSSIESPLIIIHSFHC